MADARLILGDSLEVLPGLEAGSVDAVCCDPPAGISFMGREFDSFRGRDHFIDFLASVLRECLRVLKPGGYAFVWALPRTSHWTATAIEDAGLEVRDRVAHIFGQGFPKGKGCLKPAVEDWWLARKPGPRVLPLPGLDECRVGVTAEDAVAMARCNTPGSGRHHAGGGLQGKAFERVRGSGNLDTTAGRYPPNLLLTHSATCRRVGTKQVPNGTGGPRRTGKQGGVAFGDFADARPVHDGYADADGLETVEAWKCDPQCPVLLLGLQSGESKSNIRPPCPDKPKQGLGTWEMHPRKVDLARGHTDAGSAARFFPQFSWSAADDVPWLYCSKASRREREEGLNGEPMVKLRDDLTEEQRQYVLSELERAGVSF